MRENIYTVIEGGDKGARIKVALCAGDGETVLMFAIDYNEYCYKCYCFR